MPHTDTILPGGENNWEGVGITGAAKFGNLIRSVPMCHNVALRLSSR
jgi:hypothetical protein